MITELERRALMGDPAAQQECTEKGIVLSCPLCGGTPDVKSQKVEYGLSGTIIRCNRCGLSLFSPDAKAKSISGAIKNMPIENHKEIGIGKWNTRPAPPIGRCLDCKKQLFNENTGNTWCTLKKPRRKVNPLWFCGDFEPKEREENGCTTD